MIKPHLVSVDSPLVEGKTVNADCGKMVERPRLAMMWDSQAMAEPVGLGLNICRKCREATLILSGKSTRYLYAIYPGGEAQGDSIKDRNF